MTLQKLKELDYETLPQAASSPNFLPTDYHLFKDLDNFLQNKIFNNQTAVAQNAFE